MTYSIPYILFMVALAIIGYFLHHYRDDRAVFQALKYLFFSFIIAFVGLRGFCMFDWHTYYPEFRDISINDISNFSLGEDREPAWVLFVIICKSICNNYHFMVFIQSTLLFSLLWRFFKHESRNLFLSFVLFFAFEGFVISFNLMRNSLAIAIFLNALPFLRRRRPFPYYALCLLALGFHYSAIFYFPLYFFLHKKLNKYVFIGILGFCACFYFMNISIFEKLTELLFGSNEYITRMVKNYTEISKGISLGPLFFERLFSGILIFCYYDKLQTINKNAFIYINSFLIFAAITLLFSDLSEVCIRISTLFIFSYWILYVDIVKCINIDNNRRLFMIFIGLYCLFRTAMPMGNPVYKYDNLLFGIDSYNKRCAVFEHNVVDDD